MMTPCSLCSLYSMNLLAERRIYSRLGARVPASCAHEVTLVLRQVHDKTCGADAVNAVRSMAT